MHLRSNGIEYFEPFASLPLSTDLSPNTGEGCIYSYGGSLYWDPSCNGSGTPLATGSSLWTDGGTFTYLTSTTDDLVLGASTAASSKFFFDVSEGRLGIGTDTPQASIDIAGASSTISNTSGDITITPNANLIVSQGRVGIGTSSPQEKLTLASASNFATEMATPGAPTLICNTSGGTLADGTYYYKIVASDGVGTTVASSQSSCTISGGSGAGSVSISWSGVTGASSYRIYGRDTGFGQYWTSSSTSYTDTGTAGTTGTPSTVTTAYVNKLTASGNSWLLGGNVGIGTMTPTEKLTIYQSADSNGISIYGYDDQNTKFVKMYVDEFGQGKIEANGNFSFNTSGSSAVYWGSPNVTFYRNILSSPDNTYNLGSATQRWKTLFIGTGGITTAGNVGIGTTSPVSPLSVGSTSQFQVNSLGDIIKIKNLTYSWPSSHTTDGFLKDDGSGNLTWTTVTGAGGVAGTGVAGQATFWTGTSTVSGDNAFWWDNTNKRLGIGTMSPEAKLDISGVAKSTNSYPAASSGYLTTTDYTQSRLQNLVTNGSGLMGNNYNFSSYTFSQNETHGGAGSFLHSGAYGCKFSDELIPVDAEKYYRMVVWAKSGETGGTNYNSANKQYAGITPYDIDGYQITPYTYAKVSGSTDTTLAVALNTGDTTVSLTNATGWYNGTTTHMRHFTYYGYTNSKGYTYPDYTYSRYGSWTKSVYSSPGTWAAGGISGNTITLTSPWPGPDLPAGTAIRNTQSGGTYKYITLSNVTIPNEWTRAEGYIGGWDTTGSMATNRFPYGTAYVKLLFLNNYTGGTNPTNNIRWSDIWFSELSSRNIEVASSTVPGVISLSNQSLGAGDKYFSGNVGIGTTSPVSLLSVGSTSQFQVNSSGDIVKIKNLTYSWPSSHTTDGFLKNDGSGNLTWVSIGAGAGAWGTSNVGTDYGAYMSSTGIGTFSNFTLDTDDDRLSIHSDQMEGGMSVYSSYATVGGTWPLVAFKADSSNYGGAILELTQDGTGDILQGYSGSTFTFQIDSKGGMHLRSNGIAYFEPFATLPISTDLSPNTGEGCIYSYGGSLYWDPSCNGSGTPLATGGSLWTDGGTFTYLTSTTDDLVLGASTTASSKFFFDVSEGRLGIGTDGPGYKLHVNGTAGFSSTIYAPNIGVGTDDSVVVLNSSGNLVTDEIDNRVWGTSLLDGSSLTANYLTKVSDANTLVNSLVYDNGTNVGIGTTSPQEKLHVAGKIRTYDPSLQRGEIFSYSQPGLDKTWTTNADFNAGTFSSGMLSPATNDELKLGAPPSPYLYLFKNGKYTFLSDFLGGASSPEKESTDFIDITSKIEIVDNKAKIKITEELEETSYIDRIFLRIDGNTIINPSSITGTDRSLLLYSDNKYLVMNQGDEHYLEFPIPKKYDKLEFVAEGYFIPNEETILEEAAQSIYYQDENSNWQLINTTIVPSEDPNYDFVNITNNFETYFKKNAKSQDLVKYQVKDKSLSFTLLDNELGKVNSVDGNSKDNLFYYSNAYQEIDLRYSISKTKLLEEYIVSDYQRIKNINSISQKIRLEGVYFREEEDGSIQFFDEETGEKLWYFPAPLMYELNDKTEASNGLHYQVIPVSSNEYIVKKVLDKEGKEWLAAKDRIYPVAIDATISYGSEYTISSGSIWYTAVSSLDSTHFVVSYRGNEGTAVIGTVSGSTISYGSEYVFSSTLSQNIAVSSLDSTHFVVVYRDGGNSDYGTAIIGTVSGSTISYGSKNVFNSATTYDIAVSSLDSTHFVVSYRDLGNSEYGTARIGTVSGSTISYGSEYVFNSAATYYWTGVSSLDSTHFVVVYRDGGNSGYGTARIGTVSGSTISYGSEYVFNSANTMYTTVSSLDSSHFVVSYRDEGNSSYGTAVIGTVSGSTISYGSERVFNSAETYYTGVSSLDSTHFVVGYKDNGNSGYGTARIGEIKFPPTSSTNLLCEGSTNPTNVTDTTPEFSAIGHDPDTGDTLTHVAIQVDDNSGFGSPIWDSGWINIIDFTEGNRCQNISYAGSTLSAGVQYYWRIRFKDISGLEGDWSTESAYFKLAYASGDQYWVSETLDAGSGNTYQPNYLTASWTLDGSDNIAPKFQVLGSSTGAFTGEETIYPAGSGTYYQDGGTYDINNGVELNISSQVTSAYRYWKVKAYLNTGTTTTDAPSIQSIRIRNYSPLVLQPSGQYVGIGTTIPNVALDVIGSIEYTGTITDVSDISVKENIVSVEYGLNKILSMRPVYFNMIGNTDPEIGFIAQEIQPILPEAVKVVDPEKGLLGIDYLELIPITVKAIQEQQEMINSITLDSNQLLSLNTKVNDIDSYLQNLDKENDSKGIKYDTEENILKFSNDGINWISLGEATKTITLSAEYEGAVLAGDGSDNRGIMTSDSEGTESQYMNYYKWTSNQPLLQDYDVRVRFTLPDDFESWSDNAIKVSYSTETTNKEISKLDLYLFEQNSETVDTQNIDLISEEPGKWTKTTINSENIEQCNKAGDTCILVIRGYSSNDHYVKVGDIQLMYRRKL
jgi:hypothetical protein